MFAERKTNIYIYIETVGKLKNVNYFSTLIRYIFLFYPFCIFFIKIKKLFKMFGAVAHRI